MENKSVFAERLKARRVALGLTQEQLQSYIGAKKQRVSRLELGFDPRAEEVRACAEVLQCRADWLLGLTSEEPPEPRWPVAVARFLHSLSDKERRELAKELLRPYEAAA